jgi:outer membrane protein
MTEKTGNDGNRRSRGLWIFNILLLAAIIVLYVLHFTAEQPGQTQIIQSQPATSVAAGLRIAFVDSDLLMEQYEMVPEMIKSFETSTREKEDVISEKQKEFEARVTDFQNRLQSGNISMEIAQITEQQLMREQQELMELRDELSQQLATEEFEMSLELYGAVSNFLKEYNRTRQFDLIFNYKEGSDLFIVNSAYDITPEVVELLNHEYRLRRPRR